MNGTATCEISSSLTLHNTSDQHQPPVEVMVGGEATRVRFLPGAAPFAGRRGRPAMVIMETDIARTRRHTVAPGSYEVRLGSRVVGETHVKTSMTGVSIALPGIDRVLPAGTELSLSRVG